MSLKKLLGLEHLNISDDELIILIAEAQSKNIREAEFEIDGEIVKFSIPLIGFDPDSDKDSW